MSAEDRMYQWADRVEYFKPKQGGVKNSKKGRRRARLSQQEHEAQRQLREYSQGR